MEYYSAIKSDKIFPFAITQMDLENIMISDISQTDRTRSIWLHPYARYKTEINIEQAKQTHRHRLPKQ